MALVPFPKQGTSPVPTDPDWDDVEPSDDEGGRMSFLEHLDELRKRLMIAIGSVFGGFLLAFIFIRELVAFVTAPMIALLPPGEGLIYTEPAEVFLLWLKVAAIVGVLLASPVIMTQVWLFVAPGLYSHEKKLAIPFVILTTLFFVTGATFSHYVVFPVSWQFFIGFETPDIRAQIRVAPAFSLYAKLLFACALVFQMPTLVLFLAKMGVVTPGFLMRQFKYAVLLIFVVAAVVTPPDVVSQFLIGIPMIGLYLLSVGIAWLVYRGKRKKAAERAAEDDTD
jgi:sec-independent protein translocase protein TatC